jgi:hypothetical protein
MHYEFNKRIAGIGCHHPYMCWPYLTIGLVMDRCALAATVASGNTYHFISDFRNVYSSKKFN